MDLGTDELMSLCDANSIVDGFFGCLVFFETGFLCIPGCLGVCSIDQAILKLRDLPASAFPVLELKTCATTARLVYYYYYYNCIFCFVF